MDIPRQLMGMQLPQRPPSAANPDYISPLKRDTEIGQPGRDHSGQRHKASVFQNIAQQLSQLHQAPQACGSSVA
uniref:Uncharacterized protein n=1 Tax=Romanomermis culicivorax TaxID=13658 RepID=A0A915L043_ROMCU